MLMLQGGVSQAGCDNNRWQFAQTRLSCQISTVELVVLENRNLENNSNSMGQIVSDWSKPQVYQPVHNSYWNRQTTNIDSVK